MRRLVDPSGTLDGISGKLAFKVLVIALCGLAYIPILFFGQARFFAALPILPSAFVNLSHSSAHSDLGWPGTFTRAPRSNAWLGPLLGIVAVGALGGWIDWMTHMVPARLAFPKSTIASMPGIRVAFLTFGAVHLLLVIRIVLLCRWLSREGSVSVAGSDLA